MRAPDAWAAIEHAYANPDVLADAQRRWAENAPNLFLPHAVELSASSAGHCVRERFAYLHGLLDIPEAYPSMLCKMDGGTMYGLRVATLFAAGYEATHPGATVMLESVSEFEGVPGHIDLVIVDGGKWIGEIKCSYWTGAFSGPMDSHLVQAAQYAFGQSAEGFSIITLLPAAQARRGSTDLPVHFVQNDYFAADYETAVMEEIARLRRAEGNTMPEPDVKPDSFWCKSCRFSKCEFNRNILKPKEAAA